MSKLTKAQERRLYPRLYQELPLNVVANGYDFVTSTQNVSCIGAYCHIEKYMPPFTRVMVKLALPVRIEQKTESVNVECRGVVVRTEDSSTGGFNIAIFFNGINDSLRNKISQYLNQFLPAKTS